MLPPPSSTRFDRCSDRRSGRPCRQVFFILLWLVVIVPIWSYNLQYVWAPRQARPPEIARDPSRSPEMTGDVPRCPEITRDPLR